MIVKTHKTDGKLILAICDNSLLGKKIEDGCLQLDLSSSFYNGEEKSEKEILQLMKAANSINAVGEKTIDFLLKNKIIQKENIIRIKKIPHAQVVFIC